MRLVKPVRGLVRNEERRHEVDVVLAEIALQAEPHTPADHVFVLRRQAGKGGGDGAIRTDDARGVCKVVERKGHVVAPKVEVPGVVDETRLVGFNAKRENR